MTPFKVDVSSDIDWRDPYTALVGLHECAHLKVAAWLGVPVSVFSLKTYRTDRGNISAGHITMSKTNFVNRLLIGIGGLILFIYWIGRHEKTLLKFALTYFPMSEIRQLFISEWAEEPITLE